MAVIGEVPMDFITAHAERLEQAAALSVVDFKRPVAQVVIPVAQGADTASEDSTETAPKKVRKTKASE